MHRLLLTVLTVLTVACGDDPCPCGCPSGYVHLALDPSLEDWCAPTPVSYRDDYEGTEAPCVCNSDPGCTGYCYDFTIMDE